jgi:hypothetical protein
VDLNGPEAVKLAGVEVSAGLVMVLVDIDARDPCATELTIVVTNAEEVHEGTARLWVQEVKQAKLERLEAFTEQERELTYSFGLPDARDVRVEAEGVKIEHRVDPADPAKLIVRSVSSKSGAYKFTIFVRGPVFHILGRGVFRVKDPPVLGLEPRFSTEVGLRGERAQQTYSLALGSAVRVVGGRVRVDKSATKTVDGQMLVTLTIDTAVAFPSEPFDLRVESGVDVVIRRGRVRVRDRVERSKLVEASPPPPRRPVIEVRPQGPDFAGTAGAGFLFAVPALQQQWRKLLELDDRMSREIPFRIAGDS